MEKQLTKESTLGEGQSSPKPYPVKCLALIVALTLAFALCFQGAFVYIFLFPRTFDEVKEVRRDFLEFRSQLQAFEGELKFLKARFINFASSVPPNPLPPVEKQKSSNSTKRIKRQSKTRHYNQYDRRSTDTSETLSVQLQKNGSSTEADQSWLQLTSYARIPGKNKRQREAYMEPEEPNFETIQEFCSRTRSTCPPGPSGPIGPIGDPGIPGRKGDSGVRGLPGQIGPIGSLGATGKRGMSGEKGSKGDTGHAGIPGLDGRDGLPGEPGLDGIPGRNGLDGIPGVDGIPGFDGLNGRDGRNGTDGMPGEFGQMGEAGPVGPRGIPGPRGRSGKNGTPGTPGIPGINTWMVNGTTPEKLLIPPDIPGSTRKKPRKRNPIIVMENDNLRLRCQATGEPRPQIEWSREDGGIIPTGQWKDASIVSPILNLTHVRRDHTGTYRCEASNGIPPNDYKTFEVEIHFKPSIRVNRWKVGAYNGSDADMECFVESFPHSIIYWEDPIGRVLTNSSKHIIQYLQDPSFHWKTSMHLRITDIKSPSDFGDYRCVAKNELAVTSGLVKVHEIDPNLFIPSTGMIDPKTFGPLPPNYVSLFDDLCPPPVTCPECPPQCREGRGSLYGLRVEQFGNDTYPGFKNRTLDCVLSAVGKPVYHRHTDSDYGTWMRDPLTKDPVIGNRYYATVPESPYKLYEYADKDLFRKNRPTKNYTLPIPFMGNSHVIYNGSFFFQQERSSVLIRYDLVSGQTKSLEIPLLMTEGENYLYTETQDYLDINTDENGLWGIYGLPESNNTIVIKADPWNMKVEYSWNISLSNHKFGEMFITCGVLYGIDSVTERNTKIRFALDLYKKHILDVDLPFNNPFRKTTMLGYNPKTKEIFSWDSGNQLTYPVKYIDIGYNAADRDRESETILADYPTDYEVEGSENKS